VYGCLEERSVVVGALSMPKSVESCDTQNKKKKDKHRLQKHFELIKALSAAIPRKQRRALIDSLSASQVNCLCECVYNVISESVPSNDDVRHKLQKYRRVIERVISSKNRKEKGYVEKKKKLLQTGGFLPLVLGPILGIASSIISGLISR
jgi:hypothetical protein